MNFDLKNDYINSKDENSFELYSKEGNVVFKDNKLRFITSKRRFSLLERRIINYIISHISPNEQVFRIKKLAYKDLMSQTKVKDKIRIIEACRILRSQEIIIPSDGVYTSWLASFKDCNSYIEYEISSKLELYLLNLKNKNEIYHFDYKEFLSLKSTKEQALYELLSSIKNYDNVFKMSFENFKEILGYSQSYKNYDIKTDLLKIKKEFERFDNLNFVFQLDRENSNKYNVIYLKVFSKNLKDD